MFIFVLLFYALFLFVFSMISYGETDGATFFCFLLLFITCAENVYNVYQCLFPSVEIFPIFRPDFTTSGDMQITFLSQVSFHILPHLQIVHTEIKKSVVQSFPRTIEILESRPYKP